MAFSENMTALLRTAYWIGFTRTPLFSNYNITEDTFGGYVSIYDFNQAVEDGAMVPLYYENRADWPKEIKNPEIREHIGVETLVPISGNNEHHEVNCNDRT